MLENLEIFIPKIRFFGMHYVMGWGVAPNAVETEKWYRKTDENAPVSFYKNKQFLTEFAALLDINTFRHRNMTKKEVEQKVIELNREAARHGN